MGYTPQLLIKSLTATYKLMYPRLCRFFVLTMRSALHLPILSDQTRHTVKEAVMQLIEWEVNEDGYEEQIIIPKEQRDLAAKEGISTEEKQKVAVQILNLTTGESYTGRLAITGTQQLYLPVEIQQMLKGAGRIRIQLV